MLTVTDARLYQPLQQAIMLIHWWWWWWWWWWLSICKAHYAGHHYCATTFLPSPPISNLKFVCNVTLCSDTQIVSC